MRVVLIDDHEVFRMGMSDLLSCTSDWRIVGEAGRARDAFPLIDAEQPDLVLLDVALPGMDGIVAARELRRRAPRTRVMMLTMHDEIRDVVDALNAGASGYALKTEGTAALLDALAVVTRGGRYLAPALVPRLSAHQADSGATDVLAPLSEREREIFRLAAECLPTREIAQELCISRKTVDTHLYRTYQKLGLRTLAELVKLAARLGFIHSGRRRRASVGPLESIAEGRREPAPAGSAQALSEALCEADPGAGSEAVPADLPSLIPSSLAAPVEVE